MDYHLRPPVDRIGNESVAVGVDAGKGKEKIPRFKLSGIVFQSGNQGVSQTGEERIILRGRQTGPRIMSFDKPRLPGDLGGKKFQEPPARKRA